jgi:hypothetical protein
VESSGRERLLMDGKASKAVRSKIHSPEAHGVNPAVWVRERARHKRQGSSPKPKHPVNLSRVLAPDVRYCQIKTTPHVEKKDLLEIQTTGLSPLRSRSNDLGELGMGFIEGVKPWGRERVSGLWFSAITRGNRSTCLAS